MIVKLKHNLINNKPNFGLNHLVVNKVNNLINDKRLIYTNRTLDIKIITLDRWMDGIIIINYLHLI